MPAYSQAQQKAAGAALAAKRKQIAVQDLEAASLHMYHNMTEKELEELASLPKGHSLDDLPVHTPSKS